MKKAIFVLFGIIALGLGALGVVLPVLPTTPFLLLAVYCFAKGSEKINRWFMRTALYKKYLQNFEKNKGMPPKQKLITQIFAGIMMALAFVMIDKIFIRIILVISFLVFNYVFIFRIKTLN